MSRTLSTVRYGMVPAFAAGAVGIAVGLFSPATAAAEPPPRPPNCTAADLAGIASGVAASTSTYLFTHPDVNDFYTKSAKPSGRRDSGGHSRLLRRQPAGPRRPRRDPSTTHRLPSPVRYQGT